MEVKLTKVTIRDIIHTSLEGFYKMCEEKGIAIKLEDTLTVTEIDTDEQKFRLILTNLLSNAYKFTQS
jgi:signal transduction histidine kinase